MDRLFPGPRFLLVCLWATALTCHRTATPPTKVPVAIPATGPSADDLIREGMDLQAQSRLDEAARRYQQATAAANGSFEAWLRRGRLEMLRGDHAAARMYLHAAVAIRPADGQALQWKADAHLILGEFALAVESYTRALAAPDPPSRSDLHAARAEAHLLNNDDAAALADFGHAIRLDPDSAHHLLRRGLLFQRLGRYSEAASDLQAALSRKPGLEGARTALEVASAMDRASKPAEAAVAVQSEAPPAPAAVAPAPAPVVAPEPVQQAAVPPPPVRDRAAARALWSSALKEIYAFRTGRAKELLNDAIEKDPQFSEAYNARGFTYYLMKDFQPAVADFDNALRLSPGYANAQFNRDQTLKAAERRALSQQPERASVRPASVTPDRFRKARALIDAGRFAEALAELDGLIRARPNYAVAFNTRGYARMMLRQYRDAVADFDRAIVLRPGYGNAAANRDAAARRMAMSP